jgi:hypothetical protein
VGLHPNALIALAPRGPTCTVPGTALQLIAYRDRAVSPTEVTGKKTPEVTGMFRQISTCSFHWHPW